MTSLEERICWVSITQKDVLNLVTPLPQVQFNKNIIEFAKSYLGLSANNTIVETKRSAFLELTNEQNTIFIKHIMKN